MPQSKAGGTQGLQDLCEIIVYILPSVWWNQDATLRSRNHKCPLNIVKPHHHVVTAKGLGQGWGSKLPHTVPDTVQSWVYTRGLPVAKGNGKRKKTETLPSFQNDTANAPKIDLNYIFSFPCPKPFQIKTIAKLAIERNLTSSVWL